MPQKVVLPTDLSGYERRLGLRAPEFTFDERLGLTPREQQVGRMLCYRLTDAEVAADLHLTVATVRHYVERIRLKLNVHSRRDVREKARARSSVPGKSGFGRDPSGM